MTPNILENISTWLVDWSLVTIMGNTTPPRDPHDENDEDDKDDDEDDEDDENDENDDHERQDEPAVGREPDEKPPRAPQHRARPGFPRLSANGTCGTIGPTIARLKLR